MEESGLNTKDEGLLELELSKAFDSVATGLPGSCHQPQEHSPSILENPTSMILSDQIVEDFKGLQNQIKKLNSLEIRDYIEAIELNLAKYNFFNLSYHLLLSMSILL